MSHSHVPIPFMYDYTAHVHTVQCYFHFTIPFVRQIKLLAQMHNII